MKVSQKGFEERSQSLFGDDWNTRLEDARKRREKILAEKAAAAEKGETSEQAEAVPGTPTQIAAILSGRGEDDPASPLDAHGAGAPGSKDPRSTDIAGDPSGAEPVARRSGSTFRENSEKIAEALHCDAWNRRLDEARKKRERILAEKAAKTKANAAPKSPETPQPALTPASPPERIAMNPPDTIVAPAVEGASDVATEPSPNQDAMPVALARGALLQSAMARPAMTLGAVALAIGAAFVASMQMREPDPSAVSDLAYMRAAPAEATPQAALLNDLDELRLVVFRPEDSNRQITAIEEKADQMNYLRFAFDRSAVHYFRDEDAVIAQEVAAELNADIVDLRGLNPAPPAGTLNVYIAQGAAP